MASKGVVGVLPGAMSVRGFGEKEVSPGINGGVGRRVLPEETHIGDGIAKKESRAGEEGGVRELIKIHERKQRHGTLCNMVCFFGRRGRKIRGGVRETRVLTRDRSKTEAIAG